MNTIGELLARNLERKIEEIIQVDQADEQSVLNGGGAALGVLDALGEPGLDGRVQSKHWFFSL
jgi:hypothetical protein